MLSGLPGTALVLILLLAWPAFGGAWVWRRLALRHGWLDQPEARRLHVTPTPRGGGIGIVLTLALGLLALLGTAGPYGLILAGLLLTAGGGLLDDLRPLPAVPKLLMQLAGTLPLALALPLGTGMLGGVGAVVVAWGVALALVNAWNFMDGSDAMIASQGLLVGLAAVGLGMIAAATATGAIADNPLLVLGAALAGGCLGFLPMNAPRARVFLGDVGSYGIGYVAAGLVLLAASAGPGPGQPGALPAGTGVLIWLPCSAVVIDTGLTLARRLLRGERFWLGHREHLYQRAIAAGWSHMEIAGAYAVWTLLASGLALGLAGASPGMAATAVAAVYSAGILLYVLAGARWPRPENTGKRMG